MSEDDGLICAYVLDGKGGGRPVDWPEIEAWRPEEGPLWVHLDRSKEASQAWIRKKAGFDDLTIEALLAEESRPRSEPVDKGLLLNMRGVNLNPGADPEDMVAIRLWVEESRVISVRMRRLMAVNDIREQLDARRGPRTIGDFVVAVAGALVTRMGSVIDELEDQVGELEDQLMTEESQPIRHKLRVLRRQAIALRRYLAPQREALLRLLIEDLPWFGQAQKSRLREVADRVTRYVEDLDEARDRASVVQDELMNRLSEQMNKTMYLLTVVAAIMLPLGFITGLLGINVGGIPGAESPWGFVVVLVLLSLLVAVQVWLFRRLKWI